MRFVLLHYHILKNAGTTVENILQRNFGDKFARLDSLDPNAHIANSELLSFLTRNAHVKALSSHQAHYPRPVAPDTVFFDVCFLRDPIDRIRSVYDDFRKRVPGDDPLIELARESSLGEFAEQLVARHPHRANSPQVTLLANGGAYDHPPGETDLDRAVETMLKMSVVGVVDLFDESWVAGQYFLSPVFPSLDCAGVPVNVSRTEPGGLAARIGRFRAACGRRVYTQLLEMNALDYELVRRARAEVRRRFRLVPDHSLRLRSLQERVRSLTGACRPQQAGIPQALGRWVRTLLPSDREINQGQ